MKGSGNLNLDETPQSGKMVGNHYQTSNDSNRVYWILTLATWKAGKKPNLPLQSKPSPMYPGLQVQMYEPLVLVQEAFWWQTFILHSSMSGRENTHIAQTRKLDAQRNKIILCGIKVAKKVDSVPYKHQ